MYPQNQNIYQNYGMPNPNQMMYPNPQYPNQYPNQYQPVENKRKTFTPGQYQKGQIYFQPPQNMPMQPSPGQPYMNQQVYQGYGQPQVQPQTQHQPMPQPQPHNTQQYPQQQKPKQTQNLTKTTFNPNVPVQDLFQNPPQNPPHEDINNPFYKKTATFMTVNTLANLDYDDFPQAEYSHKPFYNICGYAFNSYNGKVKNYNEDRTKTIVNYPKKLVINGKQISPRISYFGVFDGHGGNGCSNFLRDNLDTFLFKSKYFPAYPIQAVREAFINAEQAFFERAYDKNRNKLVDNSGSCALVMLIINDMLYAINLGDSRALMSTDSGENLYQITRDHKPNDDIEKRRIESSGAKVVYANTFNIDGREVVLKESDYGENFKFPYRVMPGGIAVSIFL